MIQLLKVFLDARSVRIGAAVALVTVLMLAVWIMIQQQSPCSILLEQTRNANERQVLVFAALIAWSFLLFLTVMPLGTATVVLAGFFLGPMAGVAQFASLVAASAVLYELGRDRDPERLSRELAEWPQVAKLAALPRRNGFIFSALLRLVPVVPTAVASLSASYFAISRKDFMLATLAVGWVRPVGFAILGSLGKVSGICGIA